MRFSRIVKNCREAKTNFRNKFQAFITNGPRVSTATSTKICVAEMVSYLTYLRATAALAAPVEAVPS